MAANKTQGSSWIEKLLQLPDYPNTRDDGSTTIAFYPDANGDLKVGPIDITTSMPYGETVNLATPSGTQDGGVWTQIVTLPVTIPADGKYKIDYFFTWSLNSNGTSFGARVQVDNADTLFSSLEEPREVGGTGLAGVINLGTGGGTFNSGTSQRFPRGGHATIDLTAGSHDIDFDINPSTSGQEATVYEMHLTISRFS